MSLFSMETGFTIQNDEGDDYNFDYQYPDDGQMQILPPVAEEVPQRSLSSRMGKLMNLPNRGASRMGQMAEPQRPMTSINSANYRPPTSGGYPGSTGNKVVIQIQCKQNLLQSQLYFKRKTHLLQTM